MVRLSIIGLGEHCLQSHLVHLLRRDDVRIAGIYDPKPKPIEGFSPRYFRSSEEAVEAADAILVASPDKTHLENIELGVRNGKHVFCEKPLCTDADEIGRLRQALATAEERNLVVSSCHPRRFDPPYVFVEDRLGSWTNSFGPLLNISLDFTYHRPSEKATGLHGGSLLQDHANHEIDYVHWLLGKGRYQAFKLSDSVDQYQMNGSFNDTVGFHFTGSRGLEARKFPESVHLRFSRGEVHVETYGSGVEGNPAHGTSYIFDHETGRQSPIQVPGTDYLARFMAINRSFAKATQGKAPSYLRHDELIMNSCFSVAFHNSNSFSYEATR
jgi:predicted dehydrogenase